MELPTTSDSPGAHIVTKVQLPRRLSPGRFGQELGRPRVPRERDAGALQLPQLSLQLLHLHSVPHRPAVPQRLCSSQCLEVGVCPPPSVVPAKSSPTSDKSLQPQGVPSQPESPAARANRWDAIGVGRMVCSGSRNLTLEKRGRALPAGSHSLVTTWGTQKCLNVKGEGELNKVRSTSSQCCKG